MFRLPRPIPVFNGPVFDPDLGPIPRSSRAERASVRAFGRRAGHQLDVVLVELLVVLRDGGWGDR